MFVAGIEVESPKCVGPDSYRECVDGLVTDSPVRASRSHPIKNKNQFGGIVNFETK